MSKPSASCQLPTWSHQERSEDNKTGESFPIMCFMVLLFLPLGNSLLDLQEAVEIG